MKETSSNLNEPRATYDPLTLPTAKLSDVDLSQIDHNLALTPEERLVEHQHALELVLALEASGKVYRDESQ